MFECRRQVFKHVPCGPGWSQGGEFAIGEFAIIERCVRRHGSEDVVTGAAAAATAAVGRDWGNVTAQYVGLPGDFFPQGSGWWILT